MAAETIRLPKINMMGARWPISGRVLTMFWSRISMNEWPTPLTVASKGFASDLVPAVADADAVADAVVGADAVADAADIPLKKEKY